MARALSPARPGPAARPDRGTGPAVALHDVTKAYRPGAARPGPGPALAAAG
jgi:hypothetical protein